MDLVESVRLLIAVAEEGSITGGASRLEVPQPTASRRMARLEELLGGALVDRSTRRLELTALGEVAVEAGRSLLAEESRFLDQVHEARNPVLRVLAPSVARAADLAAAVSRARTTGVSVSFVQVAAAEARSAVSAGDAHAAVVPAAAADWTVPLGLAGPHVEASAAAFPLESLRPIRGSTPEQWPQVMVLAGDDGAPWADGFREFALSSGLAVHQVSVAPDEVAALAPVVGGDGVVLCSASEADQWGLSWRAIAGHPSARTFRLESRTASTRERLLRVCGTDIGRALGAA